jgi:CBS domain-containing protein
MARDVVSVSTTTSVSEVAGVLVGKRISAVPVVGADGRALSRIFGEARKRAIPPAGFRQPAC